MATVRGAVVLLSTLDGDDASLVVVEVVLGVEQNISRKDRGILGCSDTQRITIGSSGDSGVGGGASMIRDGINGSLVTDNGF